MWLKKNNWRKKIAIVICPFFVFFVLIIYWKISDLVFDFRAKKEGIFIIDKIEDHISKFGEAPETLIELGYDWDSLSGNNTVKGIDYYYEKTGRLTYYLHAPTYLGEGITFYMELTDSLNEIRIGQWK